jgi:glycosyltransferase involved in cell wall biosynthesis
LKIVYVLESLEQGGGVKVLIEHAEGLAARGHDVAILTRDARHPWIDVSVRVLEAAAFDEQTLPQADVHVATWFPTVVPVVRARRAARVFHFSQGFELPHPHLAGRRGEIEEAYRQPIPKLVISAHLLEELRGYPGPFHVIPQAIPWKDFAPPDPERNARREPAAIGIVGPYGSEMKGIRYGLEAVALLRREGRDVRLVRASHLPMSEEERRTLVADVYAAGVPVDEMPAFYHRLDVLLFTSFDAEGSPLPPLEAMAAGVPVVLTDIPSFVPVPRDAVSRVPPGDARAMAREAARLLDEPALWAERRARGMEVARTFSIDTVLDELERIFREPPQNQKTS